MSQSRSEKDDGNRPSPARGALRSILNWEERAETLNGREGSTRRRLTTKDFTRSKGA